jgi:hypothetical protein
MSNLLEDRPLCIDCYHRMDFAYQGKNPPTKLAAMASASNLQYTQGSETWLTDSGALITSQPMPPTSTLNTLPRF